MYNDFSAFCHASDFHVVENPWSRISIIQEGLAVAIIGAFPPNFYSTKKRHFLALTRTQALRPLAPAKLNADNHQTF